MSKRRERKPNLPQDTLNRARQQLAGDLIEQTEKPLESAPEPTSETDQPAQATPPSPPRRTESSRERTSRRRTPGASSTSGISRKDKTSDPAYVRNLLANPTKIVTEDQLRQEYSYVLADLRSMGTLAAILFVALIVVAQILANL